MVLEETSAQNERTALAWQRTALAMVLTGAVAAKAGWAGLLPSPAQAAAAGLGVVAAGTLMAADASRRYRQRVARLRRGEPVAAPRTLLAWSAGVTGFGLAALAAVAAAG